MRFRSLLHCALCLLVLLASSACGETLPLHLRFRQEVAPMSGRYHAVTRIQEWQPRETAIVVCDMWDTHTCPNAALRVSQMAPRMNEVLKAARSRGVLIIHCPSNTMDFYKDHPGRKLAQQAPPVKSARPLEKWCYLDKEHEAPLPIDDTDGGCDGERTWKRGDPLPWTRQIATLEIKDGDAITDSAEAYYLMRQRGVRNLIVMGVHTNMCVLGRPFSIRQMVYQGLNVALMRDLTDTMYNPEKAPFVSHFTGTDLVVEHIEKHWCPTLTSGDFLDGREFRFPGDTRPHVAILLGEDEYQTATTLPKFAAEELGKDYRVSLVFLDEKTKATFPGVEVVNDADVLFISARRRPLPKAELDLIRKQVAAGKPVIGIRTASHAFHLRNQPAPQGLADWPDIDAVVFGGSYSNHHGHTLKSTVWPLPAAHDHPILKGIATAEFPGGGGLYQTSPLKPGTTELLRGKVQGVAQQEPVAWTFTRKDGGRSFYTSLGHPDDFTRPEFRTLLKNALAHLSGGRRPAESSPSSRAAGTADFQPVTDFLKLPDGWTLGKCSAVAVNRKGEIHLFHRGQHPILCFDAQGNYLRSWGDEVIGIAHGLRVDRDDNVWATDIGSHRVFKFDSTGKLLLALGTGKPGTEIDQFNKPTDVAFGPDGEFFVSDGYGNSRVMKFAPNGKFIKSWGAPGKGPGEFHLPHAIVVDARGRVLVGDRENDRIQIFDREGQWLETWDGFAPYGLAFDKEGILFVADARANQVLRLDASGKVARRWGREGRAPGEFDVPHMLSFDPRGNLYVAEVDGRRLQKFVCKSP